MIPSGTPLLSTIDARIEAAVFAASEPLTEKQIAAMLPGETDVAASLARISEFWQNRGIRVVRTAAGWKAEAVVSLLPAVGEDASRRLSVAAIATLAVIAMHQPITVVQIEKVRGVKLGRGILDSLKVAGLVDEVGRRTGTGQAVAYGVTTKFLERFNLESLADLPTPEEAFMLDLDSPVTDSD